MSATTNISQKLADALRAMVSMEDWDDVPAGDDSTVGTAKAVLEDFDAGPQHEDERRWVMSVAVVSADHVSPETLDAYLQASVDDGDPSIGKFGYGYIVYTHEDVDGIPEDMPWDLRCILLWAIKRGYSHVRLDPDGDYVTGLRDYEEESK